MNWATRIQENTFKDKVQRLIGRDLKENSLSNEIIERYLLLKVPSEDFSKSFFFRTLAKQYSINLNCISFSKKPEMGVLAHLLYMLVAQLENLPAVINQSEILEDEVTQRDKEYRDMLTALEEEKSKEEMMKSRLENFQNKANDYVVENYQEKYQELQRRNEELSAAVVQFQAEIKEITSSMEMGEVECQKMRKLNEELLPKVIENPEELREDLKKAVQQRDNALLLLEDSIKAMRENKQFNNDLLALQTSPFSELLEQVMLFCEKMNKINQLRHDDKEILQIVPQYERLLSELASIIEDQRSVYAEYTQENEHIMNELFSLEEEMNEAKSIREYYSSREESLSASMQTFYHHILQTNEI